MASDASDWSTAFAELERGLRSALTADQAEAVTKTPIFFKDNPFSVFINAVFVRLGEVFRNGPNYLRKLIVEMCGLCHGEIHKVVSKNEILRSILVVSYSNDPLARTLTLQILTSLADIFYSAANVHDFIRVGLDSHHGGEKLAAIEAAIAYASKSSMFFDSVFDHICSLLNSSSVPMETKRKVICIFQFAQPAQVARIWEQEAKIVQTINGTANRTNLSSILKLLCELPLRGASNIPLQIDVLLDALKLQKPELSSFHTLLALSGLLRVAKYKNYVWSSNQIITFCQLFNDRLSLNEEKILLKSMNVLFELCSLDAFVNLNDRSVVINICTVLQGLSYSDSAQVVTKSLLVIIKIIPIFNAINGDQLMSHVLAQISSDLCCNNQRFGRALVILSTKMIEHGLSIFNAILQHIEQCCMRNDVTRLETLVECVGAMVDLRDDLSDVLRQRRDQLSLALKMLPEKHLPMSFAYMIISGASDDALRNFVLPEKPSQKSICAWHRFLLVRTLFRYGRYGTFAGSLLENVDYLATTDSNHSWMQALTEINTAESKLLLTENSKISVTNVQQASACYHNAVIWFNAAGPTGSGSIGDFGSSAHTQFTFASQWCSVRAKSLEALCQLQFLISGRYQFSELNFIQQIYQTIGQFDQCREEYDEILMESFDADEHSLNVLKVVSILHHVVVLMLKQMLKVYQVGSQTGVSTSTTTKRSSVNWESVEMVAEHRLNWATRALLRRVTDAKNWTESVEIQDLKRTDALMLYANAVQQLICTCLPLPRFMFQRLQRTRVKLVISPNNTYTHQYGQSLVLKIEGIVEQKSTKKLIRIPAQAKLKILADSDARKKVKCGERVLDCSKGYFVTEYLLNDLTESCDLNIALSLIDCSIFNEWNICVEERLKVVVLGAKTKRMKFE